VSNARREITRVLIPGVCHPIAAETLESLRRVGDQRDHSLYIVGVDVEERGRNFVGVDAHHFVPGASAPEYIEVLLDICRKERIDVVVPWSDIEADAISHSAATFKEAGIATLCGSPESVQCALDKGSTLDTMKRCGIPVPDYELTSSPDELAHAATGLGYPQRRVVVKPRRSSGGRGMWVLDANADMLSPYAGPGRQATLAAFMFILRESESANLRVPGYVVMEYLPGEDYSVDALASEGEAIFVVPRRRIRAVEGISHIGEIAENAEVRSAVARVIRAMDLHLNVNVQLKYTGARDAAPMVYEVNPRISGSIVANDAAGVNLLYHGIQLALGNPPPAPDEIRVQETRMFREWVGRYTNTDQWFNP